MRVTCTLPYWQDFNQTQSLNFIFLSLRFISFSWSFNAKQCWLLIWDNEQFPPKFWYLWLFLQRYYYVVGSDASGWSREFSFTTAQSRPEQYTIAVYGDMGILHSLPTVQQLENITHSHPLDFILHIGDISYADNRLKYGLKAYQEVWDQFFDEIENLTATIPYMVCPGTFPFTSPLLHFDTFCSMRKIHKETKPEKRKRSNNSNYFFTFI